MATYAFQNLSGSVGKTTSLITFASLLADEGLRVRVYDLDQQADSTTWLGYGDYTGKDAGDVVCGRATIAEIELPARRVRGYDPQGNKYYQDIPNLTIVPAVPAHIEAAQTELGANRRHLLNLRTQLAAAPPVDITLIDGPGSSNPIVSAILLAAAPPDGGVNVRPGDYGVITCTIPADKENRGIPRLIAELASIAELYMRTVPFLAVIPCAIPDKGESGNVYPDQLNDMRTLLGEKVTPVVSHSWIVREAHNERTPMPYFGYRLKRIVNDYRDVLTYLRKMGIFLPPSTNRTN